jgi:hypothetical protein
MGARDSAAATLANIQAGAVDPSEISPTSRRILVAQLMMEEVPPPQISTMLRVSRQTIWRDIKAIRREMGERLTDVDVRALAGEHMTRAEYLASRLMRDKRYMDAWKVRRDLIADLQSLGFLVKAPEVVEIRPALDELAEMTDDELRDEMRKVTDAEFSVLEADAPDGAAETGGDSSTGQP